MTFPARCKWFAACAALTLAALAAPRAVAAEGANLTGEWELTATTTETDCPGDEPGTVQTFAFPVTQSDGGSLSGGFAFPDSGELFTLSGSVSGSSVTFTIIDSAVVTATGTLDASGTFISGTFTAVSPDNGGTCGFRGTFTVSITPAAPPGPPPLDVSGVWVLEMFFADPVCVEHPELAEFVARTGFDMIPVQQSGAAISASYVDPNGFAATLSGAVSGETATFAIVGFATMPDIGPGAQGFSGVISVSGTVTTDGDGVITIAGTIMAGQARGGIGPEQITDTCTWSGTFTVTVLRVAELAATWGNGTDARVAARGAEVTAAIGPCQRVSLWAGLNVGSTVPPEAAPLLAELLTWSATGGATVAPDPDNPLAAQAAAPHEGSFELTAALAGGVGGVVRLAFTVTAPDGMKVFRSARDGELQELASGETLDYEQGESFLLWSVATYTDPDGGRHLLLGVDLIRCPELTAEAEETRRRRSVDMTPTTVTHPVHGTVPGWTVTPLNVRQTQILIQITAFQVAEVVTLRIWHPGVLPDVVILNCAATFTGPVIGCQRTLRYRYELSVTDLQQGRIVDLESVSLKLSFLLTNSFSFAGLLRIRVGDRVLDRPEAKMGIQSFFLDPVSLNVEGPGNTVGVDVFLDWSEPPASDIGKISVTAQAVDISAKIGGKAQPDSVTCTDTIKTWTTHLQPAITIRVRLNLVADEKVGLPPALRERFTNPHTSGEFIETLERNVNAIWGRKCVRVIISSRVSESSLKRAEGIFAADGTLTPTLGAGGFGTQGNEPQNRLFVNNVGFLRVLNVYFVNDLWISEIGPDGRPTPIDATGVGITDWETDKETKQFSVREKPEPPHTGMILDAQAFASGDEVLAATFARALGHILLGPNPSGEEGNLLHDLFGPTSATATNIDDGQMDPKDTVSWLDQYKSG